MKIEVGPAFLTVEMAEKLTDKNAVITESPTKETAKLGDDVREVYRIPIELAEGNRKTILTPNQKTLNNLVTGYSDEGDQWVGKKIRLEVEKSSRGQKMIVAYPV